MESQKSNVRILPDGRYLHFQRQIFTTLLGLSSPRSNEIGVYDETYEYQDPFSAVEQFKNWNGEGEPKFWYRHRPTNRRREGGDPAKEEVRA